MKISYAITVCNEHKELDKLLTFLFEHKRKDDEVVVQKDKDNCTEKVWDICEKFETKQASEYKHNVFELNKNFAAHKNNLNKNCSGDWIFQIDADEIPNEYLIQALPYILEANRCFIRIKSSNAITRCPPTFNHTLGLLSSFTTSIRIANGLIHQIGLGVTSGSNIIARIVP